MKRFNLILSVFAIAIGITLIPLYAQETEEQIDVSAIQHGPAFVDEDGDGFNDMAPDHDADGIPNGQDEDYESMGLGAQGFVDADGDGINDNFGGARRAQDVPGRAIRNFVDADGDGINDVAMSRNTMRRGMAATGPQRGYGPQDGTGARPQPQDGTGFGPGAGTEDCDGTGPKGAASRAGQQRNS